MRAIVHIGMHKTGVTSVKNYCKRNREALLKEGILYPLSIGDPAKNIEYRTNKLAVLQTTFASELTQIPNDGTVFICSETYFGVGDYRKEMMIKFLNCFSLDISILCYLRPQVCQVVSLYQQHVISCFLRKRSLRYDHPVEYFDALMKKGYYQYSKILDRWAEYVAKESIYIRLYDRGRLFGGSTLKDVASLVGFEVFDDGFNHNIKSALSAENLYFLKTILACIEKSNIDISEANRRKILRELRAEDTGCPLDIYSKDKRYIAETCFDDNKRLAESYLESRHSDFRFKQDIDSVNGKIADLVDINDVAGIYRSLNGEIPALRNLEPVFLDCLKIVHNTFRNARHQRLLDSWG